MICMHLTNDMHSGVTLHSTTNAQLSLNRSNFVNYRFPIPMVSPIIVWYSTTDCASRPKRHNACSHPNALLSHLYSVSSFAIVTISHHNDIPHHQPWLSIWYSPEPYTPSLSNSSSSSSPPPTITMQIWWCRTSPLGVTCTLSNNGLNKEAPLPQATLLLPLIHSHR